MNSDFVLTTTVKEATKIFDLRNVVSSHLEGDYVAELFDVTRAKSRYKDDVYSIPSLIMSKNSGGYAGAYSLSRNFVRKHLDAYKAFLGKAKDRVDKYNLGIILPGSVCCNMLFCLYIFSFCFNMLFCLYIFSFVWTK